MIIMNRVLGFVFVAIALCIAAPPAAAQPQTEDLTLYIGEQQTFTPG
jgi:hypothetical protein